MLCLDEEGCLRSVCIRVNISSAVCLRLLSFSFVAESALNLKGLFFFFKVNISTTLGTFSFQLSFTLFLVRSRAEHKIRKPPSNLLKKSFI